MIQQNTVFDLAYARTHFMPVVTGVYDLGSSSFKFRSLYLTSSIVFGGTTPSIVTSTVDGTDNALMVISPASVFATDGSRGAGIRLGGNENGTSPGGVLIVGGSAGSSSNILLRINNSSATFKIKNSSDADLVTFNHSGQLGLGVAPSYKLHVVDNAAPPLALSRNQAGARNALLILQSDTTDGNSSRQIYMSNTTGGGAASDVEFAGFEFFAAVHDNGTRAGRLTFNTCLGGVGYVERWRIDENGNYTQQASNGGSVILTKASTSVRQPVANTISAAGSTASDATSVTGVNIRVTTVGSGQGIKLWDAGAGTTFTVYNAGANALKVYPNGASATINGAASATLDVGELGVFSVIVAGTSGVIIGGVSVAF